MLYECVMCCMLFVLISFNLSVLVTIICHDNGQPPLSIKDELEYSVIDVNEPATNILILNSSSIFMNENLMPGTTIGQLECNDPDIGQTIKYSLLGDSFFKFQVFVSA